MRLPIQEWAEIWLLWVSGLFLHGVKSSLIPDYLCCPCTSSGDNGDGAQLSGNGDWKLDKWKKSECIWECDSQREEERQALWLIKKIPQSKEYESKPWYLPNPRIFSAFSSRPSWGSAWHGCGTSPVGQSCLVMLQGNCIEHCWFS